MARGHGRFTRVYVSLTSGGTAEPVAFARTWSFNAASDRVDVTALGDTAKVYVAGLPDSSGEMSFWYDDASTQTYGAASDGLARKTYIYPSASNVIYWHGTAFWDFSVSGSVDGGVEGSGTWSAATPFQKVG